MSENPFASKIFTHVWNQHFNQGKKTVSFDGITGVGFVRTSALPFYTNIGKNLTKGLTYAIEKDRFAGLGHSTLLVQDVLPVNENGGITAISGLRTIKIAQYPGFLIELSAFDDFDGYMRARFKKSSRYKLKKYKKRLEGCFDISYRVFHGSIKKEAYDKLFEQFRALLEKRFAEKKVYNNNLDNDEWGFYKDVAYPMILEKKAALFVVNEKKCPIAITLLYFDDDTVIDAITVFDPDYSKFHLGSCSIMQLIAWCMEKRYTKLDFSKGYFEYKTRWCTQEYQFEHHLLYNPKSLISSSMAYAKMGLLRLKAYLRKKNLNLFAHKMTYFLRNIKTSKPSRTSGRYVLKDLPNTENEHDWKEIPFEKLASEAKKGVYDFLYLNNENLHDVTLFRADSCRVIKILGKNTEKYLVQGDFN